MGWAGLVLALRLAAAAGEAPLAVVTTSTDLQALVEAVGGEHVRVESLASPHADPHAVEVKPGQLARLKAARLLVQVGLDHEPWLAPVLRTVADGRFVPGSPAYLDASRGIELLQAETPRVKSDRGVHVHGFGNTHYWLDPENARPITGAVREALVRLAPDHAADFERNRTAFLARLDPALARWRDAMAPYRGTRVAVVHETWPYLARRFGLVVVAAVEPTPGVPPSPAYVAELARSMRESGVRLLLAEPASSVSLVRQIAARSGARVVMLVPSVGGDPAAADYVGLFEVNVRRLLEALR